MTTSAERPVTTVMSWPVATIDHAAPLLAAAETLAGDDVGALAVMREGALAGILSERDVVAHVGLGSNLEHLTVGEVMAADVVTIRTTTSVLGAARAMVEADVRHLPVLDGDGLSGMVSVRDLLAVFAEAAAVPAGSGTDDAR
ncbi:MAG: CBS domain-containing protein [Nocardioidaceae bacterium]